MANYKHMNLDDRMEIQKGLKEGKSFAEIGALIGRDGSTISKEIRNHLIIKVRIVCTRATSVARCASKAFRGAKVSIAASVRIASSTVKISRKKHADCSQNRLIPAMPVKRSAPAL